MILFVDDKKKPEEFGLDSRQIHYVRTVKDAATLASENYYHIMYIDHDLGGKIDGSQMLARFCASHRVPDKVFCISCNPIGIKRIEGVCNDYDIEFEDIGYKTNTN